MTDVTASALADALPDRYTLERELGRGGMATVYLARDLKHDRLVALKVMHPELAATLGSERFLREIRTTARLDHPHILAVLDSGESNGLLWYTMPFVRGETLRDRLRREIHLSVDVAVDLTRQIGSALDYAHREGVIHRDLKPENILLADGQARVADFGVATALAGGGEGKLTETGLAVGTPTYMSPEQASGGAVDARTDVYALGCVLYEMLAGEPPYTGPSPQAVLAKRMLDPIPKVRRVREVVAESIELAITKALARVPADRFSSAEELVFALEASGPMQSVGAGATVAYDGAVERRKRAPWRALTLVLGAALLIGAAGAVLLWRSRATSPELNANLLAVAPFDVLAPKLQLWREGLVDLLARNLDGAGPLRTVPPTVVVRRWEGHADALSAAQLGRRTGARLVVFGNLVPAGGDSVGLRASLLDAGAGRELAEFELRDTVSRVDRLGDSLTVRVLGELGRTRRLELTRVASLGSTSPAALKAFLQGEQWFRRTAWDSALANYERAVALDSNFALAHWRLGRVLGWQRIGFDSLAGALSVRAGALNHGLAPRDSLLVAVDSMIMGRSETPPWSRQKRLLDTAREAVRRYPDDADAWHTLGEVLVHGSFVRKQPRREAMAAFDRAIALDSAYAPAYIHAIELASVIYGLEAAKRYAVEYLRRAPGDATAEGIRLALRVADSQSSNGPDVQLDLKQASANVLLKAFLPFSDAHDSAEVAVQIARALAASPESSATWLPTAFRRGALVAELMARGHLNEAARAWRPDIAWSSIFLAELGHFKESARDSVTAYFHEWLHSGDLRRARDGLSWWANQGDSASIARFQRLSDSLARSSEDAGVREDAEYAAQAARAYFALARRDTSQAMRQLQQLPDSLCVVQRCYFEMFTELRLLAARGEDKKLVSGGDWTDFVSAPSAVVATLERARAAERLGEREEASRCYEYVVEVWRGADPVLQPYVAEARQALERLTKEPRPDA